MASFTTPTKSYISIKPGETKALKKSTKILAAINYGNVSYTSNCMDFTVENAQCYRLVWATTIGNSAALADSNTVINYIEILGTQYTINKNANMEHGGPPYYADNSQLEVFLKSVLPQNLMKIFDITTSVTGGSTENNYLHFQTIASIADTITMKITGGGFEDGLFIKPTLSPSNCGTTPES